MSLKQSFAFAAASIGLAATSAAPAAMRPFQVGGGEGGGGAEGGIVGWLLNLQSLFTHQITQDVKALHADPAALWGLLGLGLLYGVAHAAGPGHGKAIIASYVTANDRALRRGVLLAFLAAGLQALVAIAIVGVLAAILNRTAAAMNRAADMIALLSDLGVAAIGAYLVWTKGGALIAAVRRRLQKKAIIAGGALYGGAPWRAREAAGALSPFRAIDPGAALGEDPECGHLHIVDAAALGDRFTWRGALTTVVAAGSRPCSGALLVLVFTLSQGLFWAGVAATFAMAAGTAITTGAIAAAAVAFKAAALRAASGDETRLALTARAIEFAAALAVLGFGLLLALGSTQGA